MGLRKPQTYFAFQQFTVRQERCAMKVSTDACIQGAWVPVAAEQRRALDVGTGTGLLSLMLAQRVPQLSVDAIEIDPEAASQAAQNAAASPFASRIRVLEADVRRWQPVGLYDLILCNPPFFSQDLTGPDAGRNAVRHDTHLTASDLVALTARALQPEGNLCIMWPERRMSDWRTLMRAAGFYEQAALSVHSRAGARASSVISVWSRLSSAAADVEELIIRDASGAYTAGFTHLLEDFYLSFRSPAC